jgi:centromeric protein E
MPIPPPTPTSAFKRTVPTRPSSVGPLDESQTALGAAKRYTAPISTESRTRNRTQSTVTGTTTNGRPKTPISGRPKTPTTPRRAESPMVAINTSEMDVSRVDPEEVLVDFETVGPGDISAYIDESFLKDTESDDKVLVSIR